jgi:uncharacterized protein (DUF433 family)
MAETAVRKKGGGHAVTEDQPAATPGDLDEIVARYAGQYVVSAEGSRVAVVLPLSGLARLIEDTYDAAVAVARDDDGRGALETSSRTVDPLDAYMDVQADDDIRVRGTRIGVETVLHEALKNGRTPQQIARRYRTLTLEQVYATLLYYERHKEEMAAYLRAHAEYCRTVRAAFRRNPPPVAQRLRRFRDDTVRTPSSGRSAGE